jgi:general secretion pathway protein G
MIGQQRRTSNCGLRIADCGFASTASSNPKSPGNGFTLIELMIVVVILGLLATMVMPKILDKPEQARRTKAKVDVRSIQSALAMFKTDTGRFPTTSEGLQALAANPGIRSYSKEGYLERVPADPWGNKYIYLSPGVHSKDYDLVSYGKDGEQGGTGDNADVESWNIEGS